LRLVWLLLFVAGCPNGAKRQATAYCQGVLDRFDASPAQAASNCDSCCHQDVVRSGHIEHGHCVCE